MTVASIAGRVVWLMITSGVTLYYWCVQAAKGGAGGGVAGGGAGCHPHQGHGQEGTSKVRPWSVLPMWPCRASTRPDLHQLPAAVIILTTTPGTGPSGPWAGRSSRPRSWRPRWRPWPGRGDACDCCDRHCDTACGVGSRWCCRVPVLVTLAATRKYSDTGLVTCDPVTGSWVVAGSMAATWSSTGWAGSRPP